MPDPLAPDADAFWRSIDHAVAEVGDALTWVDFVRARQYLTSLPGSLRMLGLAEAAEVADLLLLGLQTDPHATDRQLELSRLKAALATARAQGGLPLIDTVHRRRPGPRRSGGHPIP